MEPCRSQPAQNASTPVAVEVEAESGEPLFASSFASRLAALEDWQRNLVEHQSSTCVRSPPPYSIRTIRRIGLPQNQPERNKPNTGSRISPHPRGSLRISPATSSVPYSSSARTQLPRQGRASSSFSLAQNGTDGDQLVKSVQPILIDPVRVPDQWKGIFALAGVPVHKLASPAGTRQVINFLSSSQVTEARLAELPPLPGLMDHVMELRRKQKFPSQGTATIPAGLHAGEKVALLPSQQRDEEAAGQRQTPGENDPSEPTNMLRQIMHGSILFADDAKAMSLRMTVAKAIIALELSKSWIFFIETMRPMIYGKPIEVGHELGCQESLIVLSIVLTMASFVLYLLSSCRGWAVGGLVMTSMFMFSGGTFSPTATTCVALSGAHPLTTAMVYALLGAAGSISVLLLQSHMKEHRQGPSAMVDVFTQTLGLLSIFIVISAAAITDKAVEHILPWGHASYLKAYSGSQTTQTQI